MLPGADDLDFAHFRASGDAAALARVFDRTAPKLLLLASHWTRDPAAAEDLVQVTFVQALRDAAQWDERLPVLKWLAGVLAHRALDGRKHEALRAATPLDAAAELPTRGPSPLQEAIGSEMLERVTAAVDSLEEPYHGVLVLRLVHGLEPTAIAHALGRAPATVRKQLERGLLQLRGALPASLAVLLAGLVASRRGLAAVRTAVLAAGRGAAPVAGATGAALVTIGGLLLMNKLLVSGVLAVVALGVLLWWSQDGYPARMPHSRVELPSPAVVVASLPSEQVAGAPLERTIAATGAMQASLSGLEVLVLDSKTDEPIPGIGIEVVPRDGRAECLATCRAATDARGIAEFSSLASGLLHVHVDIATRDGSVAADVEASVGPPQRITFRLLTGITLHGTVVDPSGQPVAGARVLRYRSGGMTGQEQPVVTATTDSIGAFDVRALQDLLTVQAIDDAHAPSALLSLLPEAMTTPIVLQLGDRPARLQGIVTRSGVAVANAVVTLQRESPEQTRVGDTMLQAHANSATRTGTDGRFSFPSLVAGSATLHVIASGAAPRALAVTLVAGEIGEQGIDLLPGAGLRGRVLDQDGMPITGAKVWCGGMASTETPSDGRFEFDCLPAGRASVSASASGYCSRQLAVDLLVAPETLCELRLERLPVLAGHVLDTAGRGLPGMVVTAIRQDLGRGNYRPMTDAQGRMDASSGRDATSAVDGSFTLPVMPGVGYLLDVRQKDQWLSIDGERFGVFEAPRHDVTLTLQPEDLATAFVQGCIVDDEQQPVAKAWFQIADGTRLGTVGRNTPGTRRSDAAGHFRIGPLPAHAYRIKVHPPGPVLPEFETPQFQLQPNQTLDLGNVSTAGSAHLSVHLGREGGGLFEQAMLQLEADDKQQLIFQFDAEGNIEQSLAPGSYELTIYGADVAWRRQPLVLVKGEQRRLDFVLPRGLRFSLRLALPAGETRGEVVFRTADGAVDWRDDCDASDKFSTPPCTLSPCLAPGTHTAEITCRSGRRFTASFAVLEQTHEPGQPPVPCELQWQLAK